MSLKIVRRALRDLYARGAIVRVGRDSQGIDIWKVHLPAQVPEYLHGRMLLRAYQYRLKPLPRSILIVFAASADAEGRTNGHCPSMGDLTSWFQASADAVKRALKGLVGLGLICRVKRAGGAARDTAQYDVTMDAEAISWIPGAAVKSGVQKRPRVGCENDLGVGCKNDLQPQTLLTTVHHHGPGAQSAPAAGAEGHEDGTAPAATVTLKASVSTETAQGLGRIERTPPPALPAQPPGSGSQRD